MIKINDNYGFEADDLNYILMRKTYKRRKEKGTWVTTDEETWIIDGYYATLQQLVKDVTRKELRSTKFKDLDVVLKKVEELENMVKNLKLKQRDEVMGKKINRTGEERLNNLGGKMIIKEYRSAKDIDVYFP